MLARVALTFHAASDQLLADDGMPRHPCAADVHVNTMRLAVRFMRRAYQHAFAIYTDSLSSGSPMELAQAIARSILADGRDSFNRREITHGCHAFRKASDWQKTEALRALQDFAWIEGEALLPEHGGRWRVNPRVHKLFASEAERALDRREAIRDALRLDD
jgi:hypothetical protein